MPVYGFSHAYIMSREELAEFSIVESLLAHDAAMAGDQDIALALLQSSEAASDLAEQL